MSMYIEDERRMEKPIEGHGFEGLFDGCDCLREPPARRPSPFDGMFKDCCCLNDPVPTDVRLAEEAIDDEWMRNNFPDLISRHERLMEEARRIRR